MSSNPPIAPGQNWAGNYRYGARELYEPRSVEKIQELVRRSEKIKALGSRHSFNDIADSEGILISTRRLERVIEIDERARSVTVSAGLKYGEICPELDARGYALHNLASLPHISVVGACATGTHGSGITNGNLATVVSTIQFVSGTGHLVTLNREKDGDIFNGAVVHIGGLGVVTQVTLDIEPSYSVRQDVFCDLPFDQVCEHFLEIISYGYSVSLFTKWQDRFIDQVWVKRKVDGELQDLSPDFFGGFAAPTNLHPIEGVSAENCTEQMGVIGKWYERLPHFKMGFTPSSGEELQTEYFVSLENAVDAILAVERKGDLIGPHLLVSEIRAIAEDKMWLSPCHERDSVAFHFTWKQNADEVMKLLPILEAELAPFSARPHWGKLFTTSPEDLRRQYRMLPEFVKLLNRYDPEGKFRNHYLDRLIREH
jgi:xylitol oxidase